MFQILWHRIIGAAAIIVWGGFASCVMFGTLKYLGKLRVSEEDERRGKDIYKILQRDYLHTDNTAAS